MRLYAEKSFGLVAAIVRAKDTEDVIRIANDTECGLLAAVQKLQEPSDGKASPGGVAAIFFDLYLCAISCTICRPRAFRRSGRKQQDETQVIDLGKPGGGDAGYWVA